MKYLKPYNEAAIDYLKPKSREEILKSLQGLTDEEKFVMGCNNGITWLVKDMINRGVDPSVLGNIGLFNSTAKDYREITNILLDDPRVDPSSFNNYPIGYASKIGDIELVKRLLKDPRVDPSQNDNASLRFAYNKGYDDIVKLLFTDPRVLNKLSPAYRRIHMNFLRTEDIKFNESIMNYLKPKSKEEILKSIENLTPYQKTNKIIAYKLQNNPLYKDIIKKSIKKIPKEKRNKFLFDSIVYNFNENDTSVIKFFTRKWSRSKL